MCTEVFELHLPTPMHNEPHVLAAVAVVIAFFLVSLVYQRMLEFAGTFGSQSNLSYLEWNTLRPGEMLPTLWLQVSHFSIMQ